MTEEIHPLREIIKQQAAEIARLQGHIKHIGNDALRSELLRKDALLRDALDVIERAPWKNWRTDKAITNIKEELKC
jgi:hypothetical protein